MACACQVLAFQVNKSVLVFSTNFKIGAGVHARNLAHTSAMLSTMLVFVSASYNP